MDLEYTSHLEKGFSTRKLSKSTFLIPAASAIEEVLMILAGRLALIKSINKCDK